MDSRNIKIVAKGEAVCIKEPLEYAPLGADEVLVRNEASIISTGTELSRAFGIKKGITYPVYPGYASIGRVVEVGDSVIDINKGDRVMYSGAHKEWQTCKMGDSSLEMLVKIGAQPDSIRAALLHIGLISMNGILPADVKLGDTVCVFGLGTVGLIAALLYQISGARVLGIDTVENRAVHARSAGLQNAISADGDNQLAAVQEFFGSTKGVDIAVDASGQSAAIKTAVLSAGQNGQVVLLGSPRSEHVCDITPMLNHIHMKMLTVIGAFNGRFSFYTKEGDRQCIRRNIDTISRLMESRALDADKIISHVIAPEEIMSAYDGLFYRPEEYHCVVIDWAR